MPIYLNGGSNPQAVFFNGTALTSVWANVGGSSAEVWNVNSFVPSTIGTMTGSKGSGLKVWIRDSTLTRAWTEAYRNPDGTITSVHRYAEYSCDITLDVDYPSYEFAGRISDSTSFWFTPSTTTGRISISGLPSGYSFVSLTTTDTLNIDFYKSIDGSQTIDRRIGVDCSFTTNSSIFTATGDTGITTSDYYYLYTATSGFVYQDSAVLRIEKTL